jgi:hypothetical protein
MVLCTCKWGRSNPGDCVMTFAARAIVLHHFTHPVECRADEDRRTQAAATQEAFAYPDALPHLCRRLRLADASRVAVVGGAALSAAERRAIQAADTVIRFDGTDAR